MDVQQPDTSHSSESETVTNEQLSEAISKPAKCKRKKVCCPYCDHSMVDFPRHLREYHRYTMEACKIYVKKARMHMRLNPPRPLTTVRGKTVVCCPIDGCHSVVERIDRHLRSVHTLAASDKEYKDYLKLVKGDAYKRTVPDCSAEESNNEDETETENSSFSSHGRLHRSSSCSGQEEDSDDDNDQCYEDVSTNGSECNNDMKDVDKNVLSDIQDFEKWLLSFGGGTKSGSPSEQIIKHVVIVLRTFGDDFTTQDVITNLDKLEREFIPQMLKSKQASTVKNYLADFNKFVDWAKMKRKSWMSSEMADCIEAHITHWNKSFYKLITYRSHVKKVEHRRNAVTVENVCMYLKGERANMAKEVFEKYADDPTRKLTQKAHTCARNHLIMLMVLSNATRAGPIVNLQVRDVEEARSNMHNGCHVINVVQHKTERTYGAAQISLKKEDFAFLLVYVEKIRPLVVGESNTNDVFLTWNSRPVNQSEVATIITMELTLAAGRDMRASCTVLRKSIVTVLLQLNLGPSTDRDLASLMKHSEVMQKKTYDMRVADSNMARMSNLVFKVMSGQQLTKDDIVQINQTTEDDNMMTVPETDLAPLQTGLASAPSDPQPPSDSEPGTDAIEVLSDTELGTEPSSASSAKYSKGCRSVWPQWLRERVEEAFEEDIEKRTIKLSRVKEVFNSDPNLLHRVSQHTKTKDMKVNEKKVADCVRNCYRYK